MGIATADDKNVVIKVGIGLCRCLNLSRRVRLRGKSKY